MRKFVFVFMFLLPILPLYSQDFTAAQYKKALWMVTRFFGAQRSGEGPNWMHMDSEWPTNFVKDEYEGKNISGGWFDAGDHVMFGQTQFYAAYCLVLAYEFFPTGFDDHYSADYSGYFAKGNFDYGNGTPNSVPDIVDELRYEMDFFVKITPDENTFISQKGDGGKDHASWGNPGWVSTLPNSKGGEKDGPRFVKSNPKDANMPGYAAACLAAMARLDPDENRRDTYLDHAKNAYAYAKANPGTEAADGGFYGGNHSWEDAVTAAAIELWKTTGEESYKTEAEGFAENMKLNLGFSMDYENDEALGQFMAQYVLGKEPANPKHKLSDYIEKALNMTGEEGVTTVTNSFFSRGPSGYAFLQALINQVNENNENLSFVYDQVDYLLGSNSAKKSFVIGFTENGASDPQNPHHRGVYAVPETSADSVAMKWDGYFDGWKNRPIAEKHRQFGALLGGSHPSSGFDDNMDNLSHSEVTCELNAPFVGALAYVVSTLEPVTKVGTGFSPRSFPKFSLVNSGLLVSGVPKSKVLNGLEIRHISGKLLFGIDGPVNNGLLSQTRFLKTLGTTILIVSFEVGGRKLFQVIPKID